MPDLQAEDGIALLQAAIELANDGVPDNLGYWHTKASDALRLSMGDDHPHVAAFKQIRFRTNTRFYAPRDEARVRRQNTQARLSGVRRGVTLLRAALEELQLLADRSISQPQAPTVLHPLVHEAVGSLMTDGHHRSAVESVSRAVEQRLRAKLGLAGRTGSQLADAFSTSPPKPDQPRLRFDQFVEGSESWKSAHEGAMHFAKGCFMRIRNLYVHEVDPSLDEATEALSAFSLLARWIDYSSLAVDDDPTAGVQ